MIDEWRTLLYPLGFLSAIAFGARFIIQWIQSEKAHKCVVPKLFWQLSLLGNVLLIIHSLIQVQLPICLVQGLNAVISWRNLDIMQTKHPQKSFTIVCWVLIASVILIFIAFFLQGLIHPEETWFRIPSAPWQSSLSNSTTIFWNALGTLGYFLFSARFWIQWWYAERAHTSELPLSFWRLSLIGALLSIVYFIHIRDSVNLIGPLVGIVPYLRNLIIIQKNQTTSTLE